MSVYAKVRNYQTLAREIAVRQDAVSEANGINRAELAAR